MTLSEFINNLRGKDITVMGIGVSNRPLVKLLLSAGLSVAVHDKQSREKLGTFADDLESEGCRLILGDNYLEGIDGDVIFRSPGIHPGLRQFEEAVGRGAVLTSEMEAFFEVCPCRIIAVTGSDGKTTTASVIAEILKNCGYNVHLGGNIGTPLLDRAEAMLPEDICVLELSSFQLLTMRRSPYIAVITNVAPNHLDVHKNMQEYIEAKKNIFINYPRPNVVVLNADNQITRSFAPLIGTSVRFFSREGMPENGVYLKDDIIYMRKSSASALVMRSDEILLPGVHNIENYMAAFAAVSDLSNFDAMIKTAKTFRGVEHRIELVRVLRGVKYYNDSIASSPSRTTAGLHSFKQKVILIAGGKDKGVPFDELGKEICEHVKTLVVTGWTAQKIKDAVIKAGGTMPIIEIADFDEAVKAASASAEPGDIVILSPACTSFDCFKNFSERGRRFKDIVNNLE